MTGAQSDLVIEIAGPEALAGIMVVMTAAFPPHYGEAWTEAQCRSMLVMPGSHICVARKNGRICGFAFLRTVVDEGELLMIAVDPGCQKSGIGGALLKQVTEICRDLGVSKLHLEVRENNNSALALYENDNFMQSGRRPAYYRGPDGLMSNSITLYKMVT